MIKCLTASERKCKWRFCKVKEMQIRRERKSTGEKEYYVVAELAEPQPSNTQLTGEGLAKKERRQTKKGSYWQWAQYCGPAPRAASSAAQPRDALRFQASSAPRGRHGPKPNHLHALFLAERSLARRSCLGDSAARAGTVVSRLRCGSGEVKTA